MIFGHISTWRHTVFFNHKIHLSFFSSSFSLLKLNVWLYSIHIIKMKLAFFPLLNANDLKWMFFWFLLLFKRKKIRLKDYIFFCLCKDKLKELLFFYNIKVCMYFFFRNDSNWIVHIYHFFFVLFFSRKRLHIRKLNLFISIISMISFFLSFESNK